MTCMREGGPLHAGQPSDGCCGGPAWHPHPGPGQLGTLLLVRPMYLLLDPPSAWAGTAAKAVRMHCTWRAML